MRYLFSVVLILSSQAYASERFSHALWDSVVARHGRDSAVDYRTLKEDVDFWTYLDKLSLPDSARSDTLAIVTDEEREAFWINAFNASMVKYACDRYPARSLKIFGGGVGLPWEKKKIDALGELYSFNELRSLLVKQFRDPRIDLALFLATKSSPNLKVYHPETLSAELDSAVHRFVNDKRFVRIDRAANTVTLSKLLDWYGNDFISERVSTILNFIAPFVDEEDRSFLHTAPRIFFMDFDWTVSEAEESKK